MGQSAILEKPHMSKVIDRGAFGSLAVGSCGITGYRGAMEDEHVMVMMNKSEGGGQGKKDRIVIGVFDGHAGDSVSRFLRDQLPQKIFALDSLEDDSALVDVCLQIDAAILRQDETGGSDGGGSTATFVVIEPSSSSSCSTTANCGDNNTYNVVVCNVGDSRILHIPSSSFRSWSRNRALAATAASPASSSSGSGGGSGASERSTQQQQPQPQQAQQNRRPLPLVAFSTKDHKPTDPLEQDRIERAGGSVSLSRVDGSLAVARAFGDPRYKIGGAGGDPKRHRVTAVPDISRLTISEGDLLFLSCDGVFEPEDFTNEEVASFLLSNLHNVGGGVAHHHLSTAEEDEAAAVAVAELRSESSDMIPQRQQQQCSPPERDDSGSGSTTRAFPLENDEDDTNSPPLPPPDPASTVLQGDLGTLAAHICHEAVRRGSKDNISAVVVRVLPTAEAAQKPSMVDRFGVRSFVPGYPDFNNNRSVRVSWKRMAERGGLLGTDALKRRFVLWAERELAAVQQRQHLHQRRQTSNNNPLTSSSFGDNVAGLQEEDPIHRWAQSQPPCDRLAFDPVYHISEDESERIFFSELVSLVTSTTESSSGGVDQSSSGADDGKGGDTPTTTTAKIEAGGLPLDALSHEELKDLEQRLQCALQEVSNSNSEAAERFFLEKTEP